MGNSMQQVKALSALGIVLMMAMLAACGENPEALVSAAKKNIANKEYKAAAIQLKNALQKETNHKEGRFLLGQTLTETGDMAGAEKEFRRALDLGYDKERATPQLARTVFEQGKLEDFVNEFALAQLSSRDGSAELKAMLGHAHLGRGKTDAAVVAFEDALTLKPGLMSARIGKAKVAALKNDLDDALRQSDEILADSPKEREVLVLKAEIARARGKRDEVLTLYRQLVEYYQKGAGEHYALVMALIENGAVEEAIKYGQQLEAIAPKDPRSFHVRPLVAFRKKDFTAAHEFANKTLSLAPAFVPAHLVSGASSYQLKSYQQAIEHLEIVAKQQKRNGYARQLLAASFMAAGDRARASREVKDALDLLPNDPRLLLLAGEIAVAENDLTEAAKYFERSAAQGGSMAAARLGQARIAAGQTDEGLRILEGAAKDEGDKSQSALTLVLYHLRRGEMGKAMTWIDSIEKKQPGSPLPPSLRGIVLATQKDFAGARKQFGAALQKDGAYVLALDSLARLDVQEKKTDDAKRRYEEVLGKAPRNEPVALAYSRMLFALGEKSEVTTSPLRAVIKNDPTATRARLALVEALLRANDTKQALAAAQEAAAAAPDNPSIVQALGPTQQVAGDFNQALSTYANLAKLQPQRPEPLMLMAETHLAAGDTRQAQDSLKKVLEIRQDWPPALQAQVMVHMRAKEHEPALEIARRLRQKNPKDIGRHELEAAVLGAMLRWGDAADLLQQAYTNKPNAGVLTKLYDALAQGGKKERAHSLASEWIAKNPKDIVLRMFLAERAAGDKDFQGAIRYYKEALAVQPKNALVLNNLAWAADQVKDPRALHYAEEANTLAPNVPAIMDTLGWMLVQHGEKLRGVELLEKASKGAPQVLEIRFNFACALIQAGRKVEAKKELEFLASMGGKFPQNAEVGNLLKQL
ncbi:MAG: PEP-CTERM system TPR-repeat protein PrsT [Betaproteobacteria bacterium]|nr:PEP-CTERM system TPR-repeat protein PrsT [Betaproteobacteria bacterium]